MWRVEFGRRHLEEWLLDWEAETKEEAYTGFAEQMFLEGHVYKFRIVDTEGKVVVGEE